MSAYRPVTTIDDGVPAPSDEHSLPTEATGPPQRCVAKCLAAPGCWRAADVGTGDCYWREHDQPAGR